MNRTKKKQNNKDEIEKEKLLNQINDIDNQLAEYNIDFELKDFFHVEKLSNTYTAYNNYILNKLRGDRFELDYQTNVFKVKKMIKQKNGQEIEELVKCKITDIAWAGRNNHQSNKFLVCTDQGTLMTYSVDSSNTIKDPNHIWILDDVMFQACAIEKSENRIVAGGGFDGTIRIGAIDPDINNELGNKKIKNHQKVSKNMKTLTGHLGGISNLKFLNTTYLLSGSYDSIINLWDITSTGKIFNSYRDHTSEVSSLDISDVNGNIFVSGSGDTTVKLWDIRLNKACVASFQGCDSSVNCVKFVPGRMTTFAAGSEDSTIKIFDYRAYREIGYFKRNNDNRPVNSIFFNYSGSFLFSTVVDKNEIYFWDLFSTNPNQATGFINGSHLENSINNDRNKSKDSSGYTKGTINERGKLIAVSKGYQVNVFNLKN